MVLWGDGDVWSLSKLEQWRDNESCLPKPFIFWHKKRSDLVGRPAALGEERVLCKINIVLFFFNGNVGRKRYVFFPESFYFQKCLALRLLRVRRMTAPQLRCILSRGIHFWQCRKRLSTLSIDSIALMLQGWPRIFGNTVDLHRFPLNFNGFHWILLIFIGFRYFRSTLTTSERWNR